MRATFQAQFLGHGSGSMSNEKPFQLLLTSDLDVHAPMPSELERLVEQGLVQLNPWLLLPRELAKKRMTGLRERYRTRYVPFARRQDNDDLACLDPDSPGQVVIVHDFAAEGSERVGNYQTFWDWFRSAIEDLIEFEP